MVHFGVGGFTTKQYTAPQSKLEEIGRVLLALAELSEADFLQPILPGFS